VGILTATASINCVSSTRHDVSDVLGLFQTSGYLYAKRIKNNREMPMVTIYFVV
jgi:hypothetical protein